MTDKEFISKLLDQKQPMMDDPTRFSTIALLLKGARKLFGCDSLSGEYKMNEINEENFMSGTYHSFQFSGLINYLIFLEQIGSIFRPRNPQEFKETNGIFCALKHFSSLKEDSKINAIVSLRNSLAHKFGLATEKNPKNKPPRKFTISIKRNSGIVQLPEHDWNGSFSDKADETSTTVFIIDLVTLIESVYEKVVEENEIDNLDILLHDGMNELRSRYTINY